MILCVCLHVTCVCKKKKFGYKAEWFIGGYDCAVAQWSWGFLFFIIFFFGLFYYYYFEMKETCIYIPVYTSNIYTVYIYIPGIYIYTRYIYEREKIHLRFFVSEWKFFKSCFFFLPLLQFKMFFFFFWKKVMVLSGALFAHSQVCPTNYEIIHSHFRKLTHLLADMAEWGQVIAINLFLRYGTKKKKKKLNSSLGPPIKPSSTSPRLSSFYFACV